MCVLWHPEGPSFSSWYQELKKDCLAENVKDRLLDDILE